MNAPRHITPFDTEGWPIDRAMVAPPLVCLQYAEGFTCPVERGVPTVAGRILHLLLSPDAEAARAIFEKWLASETILVAHNAAHDVACLMVKWPDLIHAILDKFARGQIHCTIVRQKLLDCALGRLQEERPSDEDYGLEAVAGGFGYVKHGDDPWRMRYPELADVPVELWPADADTYARHDPEAAGVVWWGQELCDQQWTAAYGSSVLYAGGGVGECALRTESAFDLHTATAWGLRTHRERVERLRGETQAKLVGWREELQRAGLVRILTDRGRTLALKRAGLKVKDAKPETVPDTELVRLLTPAELAEHTDPEPSKTKASALQRMLAATADKPDRRKLTKTGEAKARERAQAQGIKRPSKQQLAACLTEAERTKYVSCDYDAAVLSGDEMLVKLSEYGSADIMLGSIEDFAEGFDLPLQAGFDVLKATGRTSSFKPGKRSRLRGRQLQNVGGDSGQRECCVPRPGNGFIQGDYPGAELHTHAQNCVRLFGRSKLADMLRAGIDPHLQFGASTLGIAYDYALANKKLPEIKAARGRAKPANFGFPGCMGAEKFVLYSRAQWGVIFTLEEAVQIRAQWLEYFDENRLYFDWVQSGEGSFGGAIQHFVSGRWRGGATFSAKCNGYFQGLAADAALRALRAIVRETFDPRSPLFGFHLVNFIHDEIIMEGPLDRCSAAAKRMGYLMREHFNTCVPDVPIGEIAPVVMLCWAKDAEPVKDPAGELLPWDLHMRKAT